MPLYNHLDIITVCFFFSSRRRHSISLRDWSSDVCSSDLGPLGCKPLLSGNNGCVTHAREGTRGISTGKLRASSRGNTRSEERRVGKECRSRVARYDSKTSPNISCYTVNLIIILAFFFYIL